PQLGLMVGVVCVAAPLLALTWNRWPVIVPFSLYAALVPFDSLPIGGIGNLPRLLGAFTFASLLFSVLLRRQALKPSRAIMLWAIAALWMTTTLAWTALLPDGETRVQQIVQLVGLGFVLSIVRVSIIELNAVVISTIIGGVAAGLFEFWLYQTGSFYTHSAPGEARACIEVGSGCIDANFFAAGLLLPIMLAIIAGLRSRNLVLKGFFVMLALAAMLGVFVSGSRGAFTALAAGLLYLLVRSRYRIQLTCVAVAGLLLSFASPVIWARFNDPTQGEGSGRFESWQVGFAAFRGHWLIGTGIGSYRAAYEAAYLRVYETLQFFTPSQDPHSLIVQTAVELGAIGIILVFGAWIVQMGVLRAIPKGSPLYDLRCAIEGATIALFIMALSVDLMTFKFPWLCFYLAYLTRSAWQESPQAFAPAPVAPPPVTFARVVRPELP
ncbi:MAG TPA: O-antigen ligase family protein, partial [Candidatus Baltobacteraceae bacterium]